MSRYIVLYLVGLWGIGGCAHHPQKKLVMNRCKAQVEVLHLTNPDQKIPKLSKECDGVFSIESCRTAWREHAHQCDAVGIPTVIKACSQAYCNRFEEAPPMCEARPTPVDSLERYTQWEALMLAILKFELGTDDAALIHAVIGRKFRCITSTVSEPLPNARE